MKKNNFFSGMGAKLALAVVALTTVTFTSCEKEDMDITVKMNPAKVTLDTEVIYFNEEGKPATVNADVTYDGGTNNVFTGTEAAPAINKTVAVKAVYNGLEATKNVKIEVGANTTATIPVTIYIVAPSEATLDIVETVGKTTDVTKWSKPEKGHGVSHDGAVWNENPNEYFVTIKGTYPTVNNQTVTAMDLKAGADHVSASMLDKFVDQEEWEWEKDGKDNYEYTASAYSIFAAYYTITTAEVTYTIVNTARDNEEVAVITAERVISSAIAFDEKAHPDHTGHYSHGHGHGHGDASNAGGGIIFAD